MNFQKMIKSLDTSYDSVIATTNFLIENTELNEPNEKWTYHIQECSQQANSKDCGIFVCLYFLFLTFKQTAKFSCSQQAIIFHRHRIALDLLNARLSLPPETRIGLPNLGNTCFVNAVLQAMFSIRSIFEFQLQDLALISPIWEEFNALYRLTLSGVDSAAVVTHLQRFMNIIFGWNSPSGLIFAKGLQHDAHEFMVHLLSELQELMDLHVQCTLTRHKLCTTCLMSTENDEVTYPLSLAIKNSNESSSIYELLQHFTESELQNCECTTCGKLTEHICCLKLKHVPDTLILHLNRFAFSSSTAEGTTHGRTQKIETFVHYPSEIDIEEFTFPKSRHVYSLTAVINHYGSMDFGHYSTLAKSHNSWSIYDDLITKQIESNPQPDNKAYIIVYTKNSAI